jgi:hypothetical protein
VIDRRDFLAEMIGTPWKDRGMCWGMARHVEFALFDRALPDVVMPPQPSWAWIITEIETHAERSQWREVPPDPMGLIRANDGALMLMGRRDQPAHIGVWLRPEGGVIHAPTSRLKVAQVRYETVVNAVFETPVQLRTAGWCRQILYEPIN